MDRPATGRTIAAVCARRLMQSVLVALVVSAVSFFMMRALPLDYVVAGVPGAILGYYHAFHLSLNSHDAEARATRSRT